MSVKTDELKENMNVVLECGMPLLIPIKCISGIKGRWENNLTGNQIF